MAGSGAAAMITRVAGHHVGIDPDQRVKVVPLQPIVPGVVSGIMKLAAAMIWLAACGSARPPVRATVAPPPATAPIARASKVRTVEGITEYQLTNGLQVLLVPDPSQSTITVNVTYRVGSRLEGYGETGMAHLLEHMMFKGSPKHRNVLKLLEERGGQANGSTSYDRTNYYETLPASQDNLEWTLDLEADRMVHAEVSVEDLASEFSVVRNELEGGENDPASVLDERVSSTAFLWHNYGKSTIGSRSDIEKVPAPALRAFYEKFYEPDDATLIVAGTFDEAPAIAAIERAFGPIAKPTRELAASYTVEPAQDGERSVTLRRKGEVSIVEVAYHGVAGSSADFSAIAAAADLLGRQPSGLLYGKLVATGLAASLAVRVEPLHDPNLVTLSAQVRDPANVTRVEQLIESEVETLAISKLDPKALERWRIATLNELELAFNNSQLIATLLSEYIALGDWRSLFALRDQAKSVTLEDVQRVAKLYFKRSNRTVGTFLPVVGDVDRAPLTATPPIAELVRSVKAGQPRAQGEQFAATFDNLEARTVRASLPDGIEAAFLVKQTRGAKVHFALNLHWGDEKALQRQSTTGRILGEIMLRGTTKKSEQALRDLEAQLKAHITLQTNATGLQLEIETVRGNLPAVVDLAAEILTSPSFPAKEFEAVRQEDLATSEAELESPDAVVRTELAHLTTQWPKSDPRYTESAAERIADLKKLQLGAVKQFYKDFVGAGHGELAVVGDFDAGAVRAQVGKLVKPWQTKRPYTRLDRKPFGLTGQRSSIEVEDKEQTTLGIAFDIQMKDTDADYAAWLIAAHLLGGYTGSRLWNRLRETEGLSYGVGTNAHAGDADDAGGFDGFVIVAPQNLAKARASLLEEFTNLATKPIPADELARAKAAWVKDEDTSLSDDDFQLALLARQLELHRTMAFSKELRKKIEAVTPADLERVTRKYYDVKRLTIVDAGDQAKAK